ncbi:FUSC family protein [Streptomyces winkii]|uniref:FUSC family protein n=1 Tax=Streptomyces winkii TaxID=3051178 RepID=UPI0028D782B7|nr:aromatic acid exporter family protein [Streptomyces sp. DSM 40971]
MAEASAPPRPARAAPRRGTGRLTQWLHRARSPDGHERQTLTLIGKSTLVASISWFIAYVVMHAQTPAFAPFSAVLIVQITAYQSLLQALRYVGAVSVGVSLQGFFGALAGPNLVSFVLVALVAVTIGRWRRLGAQGPQVATAAFFAFSTYAAAASQSQGLRELGQIVLLVLIGCGVGIVVNVLVLPPMRYRSAEYGIRALGRSLCDLAVDISEALRAGEWGKARTEDWRYRANRLGPMAAQAQSSVRTAWESTFYHPRRLLRRHRDGTSFTAYQQLIDALERVTYQMASMTRSLDQWHEAGDDPGHREFLSRYGDFLARCAEIAAIYARIDEDRLHEQVRELRAAGERAYEARELLAEAAGDGWSLSLSDPARPFGVLLVEAVRLLDEVEHTCGVLSRSVNQAPDGAAARTP